MNGILSGPKPKPVLWFWSINNQIKYPPGFSAIHIMPPLSMQIAESISQHRPVEQHPHPQYPAPGIAGPGRFPEVVKGGTHVHLFTGAQVNQCQIYGIAAVVSETALHGNRTADVGSEDPLAFSCPVDHGPAGPERPVSVKDLQAVAPLLQGQLHPFESASGLR